MKTVLPVSINSVEEAKAFLTELHKNNETFHPEDDAHDLSGDLFTSDEADQLNKLMEDIYNLPGNESVQTMVFDPCGFLLDLGWLTEETEKES